jgi:hypothetical protein
VYFRCGIFVRSIDRSIESVGRDGSQTGRACHDGGERIVTVVAVLVIVVDK